MLHLPALFIFYFYKLSSRLYILPCLLIFSSLPSTALPPGQSIQWSIEKSHPWRAPFGLDRVGSSLDVVITRTEGEDNLLKVEMICLNKSGEINRISILFPDKKINVTRQNIPQSTEEVTLYYETGQGKRISLGRKKVPFEKFECDAVAEPEKIINPIDMGTILVPADWLLLEQGEKSVIRFAAIDRQHNVRKLTLNAWFSSSPQEKTKLDLTLTSNKKQTITLTSPVSKQLEKDILNIALTDNKGATVWNKEISVMISSRMDLSKFGAIETRLRYDVPILNIVNGKNQPLNYANAWKNDKPDYVVCFPNGSRWVFWRGASYIPIWASTYNTGLSYEWAERISPNDGFTDCPEPLMDKELRYGKVEIIESTPARVHVRWNYQSCDFNYRVNGDFATEDYFFYPDGTGTRVLTLSSIPEAEYELSEFILLGSQASIPMDIIPDNPLSLISIKNGEKRLVSLPEKDSLWKSLPEPIIYSIKIHRDEPLSAFSFNPLLTQKPYAFPPIYDKGVRVTPAYWGGHWPLSQGFNTKYAINESLWSGPSHNSLTTWATKRPEPIRSNIIEMRNALGVQKKMKVETWTWLIGMANTSEDHLLHIAMSYAEPPTLDIQGGRVKPEIYSSERKALQIIAEKPIINIKLKPIQWTINPVFEISGSNKNIMSITMDDKPLSKNDYAWDGKTLWIQATLSKPTNLRLEFEE